MRPEFQEDPRDLAGDPPSSLGSQDPHRSIAYSTLGLSYADSETKSWVFCSSSKVLPPRTLRNYRV